jgi:hypothetical protein
MSKGWLMRGWQAGFEEMEDLTPMIPHHPNDATPVTRRHCVCSAWPRPGERSPLQGRVRGSQTVELLLRKIVQQ